VQKKREHVQEALVKETVLNDEVADPEQRGVLSVGRDVCYITVFSTQLYHQGVTVFGDASAQEECNKLNRW
jgi:hypothetical protein